jgi:hypothetical protein
VFSDDSCETATLTVSNCGTHISVTSKAALKTRRLATLSELVEIVARVEALDQATVTLIARAAREAGLIKTGGRGLSAAKMGFSDAANLLIGVNVSSVIREAPELVATYRDLEGWDVGSDPQGTYRDFESWEIGTHFSELFVTPKGRYVGTFGRVFESILAAFSSNELPHQSWCASANSEFRQAFSKRRHTQFQLTFFKPEPRVDVRMMLSEPGPLRDGYPVYKPPLLHLVFKSPLPKFLRKERTDRIELTRIGTFTLSVVATSLTSPLTASNIIAGKRRS